MSEQMRRCLEMNGGQVSNAPHWRFLLPPAKQGYADAQIDDYGQTHHWRPRRYYPWRPGVHMSLQARFSHPAGCLLGTAGFGFWNAPFGDPTIPLPALPQATWFFYASEPSDLPLAESGTGRGWFAAALDATTLRAKAMIPFAPVVLLLNQWPRLRRSLWPKIRRQLGISFQLLSVDMTEWHEYELWWGQNGCEFRVDSNAILETPFSPRGPLGFVCWLDNQYMVLTVNGRFRWGVIPVSETQWMEVKNLQIIA
ncbi:MAG: hypothetical protein H6667_03245 [Ardenticatenaceae bacterium]|nr:hypothetical protein [Ardenticatenaceae bacterium]MCB9443026.1 hypothetical protein [Ardenticatenaceae bacterium]